MAIVHRANTFLGRIRSDLGTDQGFDFRPDLAVARIQPRAATKGDLRSNRRFETLGSIDHHKTQWPGPELISRWPAAGRYAAVGEAKGLIYLRSCEQPLGPIAALPVDRIGAGTLSPGRVPADVPMSIWPG